MKRAALVLLSVSVLYGCSSNTKPAPSTASVNEKQDPVTIRVGVEQQWLNEEEFNRYIVEPVKKKYPWITVEQEGYGKGRSLTELVAAGETPDLIAQNTVSGMQDLHDMQLFTSITDLVQTYKLDISRFESETIEAMKANTLSDDLKGLPYTRHFSALYYNKDIFDKFGVSYPRDGMTWDQVYELAKKLTRKEDGIQYRGLELLPIERPASQLSIPYVDPATRKALINTDSWKKVLELGSKVHLIQGNEQQTTHATADALFVQTQTLAMHATINILFEANFEKYPNLNWDMVTYPVWPEAPGLGMRIDAHCMMISNTSKNKEAAFLVAATLASEEVQMDISRHARFSILVDPKISDAFGKDISFLNGKNVQAIYKTKPAKSFKKTEYDSFGISAMRNGVTEMVNNGKDVNTVLREAEEKVNKQISEKEAAKGK